MICGLGEEECTRFRKKKKKNKEKKRKKPHRGQKWVSWDEKALKTYNRVKYFMSNLSRFLNETAFLPQTCGAVFGS